MNALPVDAWEKKMEDLVKETKRYFQKYVPGKSLHGEGIRESQVELYGVWECVATGKGGTSKFRIVIEDRAGSAFSGEWIALGVGGKVRDRHHIRGDWASVKDVEVGVLLGLYLNFVIDGATRMTLTIPFHECLGDQIVGSDDQGTQYVSRNVEPRTKGF